MVAELLAFPRRDLAIAVTYRLSFLQSVVMMVLGLISFNFISTFVNEGAPPSLAPYGDDYFTYGLVGLSIALFAQSVVGLFPAAVRGAQVTGTLEVMLSSRVSLPMFLTGSALYGLVYAVVQTVGFLAIGIVLFGADLRLNGAAVALIVLGLTTCTFLGAGILASAFFLWFKQREPFTSAFVSLSLLLSGVVYPPEVLPAPLEALSVFLPLTHAITALRATLIQGSGSSSIFDDLAVLALFALLLPASTMAFGFAMKQARRNGSLGHY